MVFPNFKISTPKHCFISNKVLFIILLIFLSQISSAKALSLKDINSIKGNSVMLYETVEIKDFVVVGDKIVISRKSGNMQETVILDASNKYSIKEVLDSFNLQNSGCWN